MPNDGLNGLGYASLVAVLNQLPMAFGVFDADRGLIFANPQFHLYHHADDGELPAGTSLSDILDRTVSLIDVDDVPAFHRTMMQYANDADNTPREVRTHANQYIRFRFSALPDAGCLFTLTDFTKAQHATQLAAQRAEQLQAILDHVPHGVAYLDKNCDLALANRDFYSAFDFPAEMAPGTPGVEFTRLILQRQGKLSGTELNDAAAARLARIYRECAGGHISWDVEHRADGRVIEIRRRTTPAGALVETYSDVTEREARNAEIENAASRYRAVVNDQTEMICRFDTNYRLTFVNGAYRAAFEAPGQPILGKSILEVVPDKAARDAIIDGLKGLTPEAPFHADTYNETIIDGRKTWQTWVNRALFDADGNLAEYQAVGRDVTLEREAMEAVGRSEQHFRELAAAHPVPVVVFDWKSGRVIHASKSASELVAPDRDIIEDLSVSHLFPDDGKRAAIGAQLNKEGVIHQVGLSLRTTTGKDVPVEVTARLLTMDDTQTLVCGILDISQRMKAEEEITQQREALAQSEKMSAMGSLLASLSHELNNPLSIVVGQSQLLGELAEDEAVRQRAGRLHKAADRCARIVRTFLAMARQKAPVRTSVDLNALIHEAQELVHYAISTSGVELVLSLSESEPVALGDRDQLLQVIMNILINAQQALADHSGARTISVVTRIEAGCVAVDIYDTGPGIPDEIRARIFEPFFTTKPEGFGTGIGLAVCRNIVEAHGGTLKISNADEGGARFKILLPMASAESGGVAEDDLSEHWNALPTLSILIVDDETEIADTARELLAVGGHKIHLASNGVEALKVLDREDIDIVISDLQMPVLDGPGLWNKIDETGIHPTARVGFITGDTLSRAVRRFMDESDAPLLEKPFQGEELKQLVLDILDQEI